VNDTHSPKKSLGQNFLTNPAIVDKLIEAAEISANDVVVEIGPGKGVITQTLAKRAKYVYAIDLDSGLIILAQENTKEFSNIDFIHHDILTFDFEKIPSPYKVVGAIPYNITSPIIHLFLTTASKPASLTLIMQKEVADKIVAQPPHATYLSMFVASQGEAVIQKNNIPPGSFNPPPKVYSAILSITVSPKFPYISPSDFSDFLHTGFQHPRKMLRGVFPEDVLSKVEILPTRRPSELTLDDWARLYEIMRK